MGVAETTSLNFVAYIVFLSGSHLKQNTLCYHIDVADMPSMAAVHLCKPGVLQLHCKVQLLCTTLSM